MISKEITPANIIMMKNLFVADEYIISLKDHLKCPWQNYD